MLRFAHLLLLAMFLVSCPGITTADDDKDAPPKKIQPRIEIKGKPIRLTFTTTATRPATTNNLFSLVRNPRVKEEVKLTPEQDATILEAYQKQLVDRRAMSAQLRELDPAKRKEKLAEMQQMIKEQTSALNKSIRETLKPEQVARLDQISVQRQGLSALSNPEITKKLKLTDEQLKQIAAAQQEGAAKRQKLMQDLRDGKFGRDQLAEKTQEMQKQTEQAVMELLTMEQQTRFNDMKGKTFDFGGQNSRAFSGGAIKLRF